ncbi:MAG: hypothetical protein U0797_30370 [Gemmataceae bacterium]
MSLNRIAQHEVEPLPRWARRALAARCVRRARALIQPPPAQAGVLDEALVRLDQATGAGSAGDDLADVAARAYTLALDNVDAGGDDESSVVTCMVAHAAAFAAEAATLADSKQAAHLVAQSVDFAIHAYRLARRASAEPALVAMRADLERLQGAAASWDQATPVPGTFFPRL